MHPVRILVAGAAGSLAARALVLPVTDPQASAYDLRHAGVGGAPCGSLRAKGPSTAGSSGMSEGNRRRLGVLVPSSNTTVEDELRASLPSAISMHVGRLPLTQIAESSLPQSSTRCDY